MNYNNTNNQFELRATFALNNMAIIMMAQSAPEAAFETFRGAVKALKLGTHDPGQAEGRHRIRNSLQQAILLASLCTTTSSSKEKNCPMIQNGSLRIVSHGDAAADFTFLCFQQQQQQQQGQQNLVFHLIRIDEEDQSLLDPKSMNLLTSMILYNYAMASLCRLNLHNNNNNNNNNTSQLLYHPEFIRRAYEDSIVILQLARNLLKEAAAEAAAAHSHTMSACSSFSSNNSWNTTHSHLPLNNEYPTDNTSLARPPSATSDNNNNNNNNNTATVPAASSLQFAYNYLYDEHDAAAFRFSRAVCNMTAITLLTMQQLLNHAQRYDEAFACITSLSHIRALASVFNDPAHSQQHNNCYYVLYSCETTKTTTTTTTTTNVQQQQQQQQTTAAGQPSCVVVYAYGALVAPAA